MLLALELLLGLVDLVFLACWIIILIHAFKNGGVLQGFLCFFIPFYPLYYAFAKFEHKKKNLIIAGFLGAYLVWAAFFGLVLILASTTR